MTPSLVGDDARKGKCTNEGSRESSLKCYVIVSEDLLIHISDFYVSDANISSDHSTVTFVILNSIFETKDDDDDDFNNSNVQINYVWYKSLLDS